MTTRMPTVLIAVGLLWIARRYYRNWGATKEEEHAHLPGDEVIRDPVACTTSAEWIDATADAVWASLLHAVGLEDARAPEPAGDGSTAPAAALLTVSIRDHVVARVPMSLYAVDPGRSLVLRATQLPCDLTTAWVVESRWQDRARVIVRVRIALRHPGDFVLAEAAGPVAALVVRSTLTAMRDAAQRRGDVSAKVQDVG